ncbi:PREDICTED: uncharacterized protein LOC109583135 [Amphimedon queenslandica]|uniref:Death domain-containing protein n=2 Tax=Amphimedon queenslandica TaxID=400682 RepID=A0AAN0JB32_AMPQE|nr:PREDICTED: uncharacterized protein LOC109583135 [Amphimedon queenslandica]|eukprot:XP_019853903.1 PREDICTED: uncharacterized protein LOC109583135 [Amphimedon queenslandica]
MEWQELIEISEESNTITTMELEPTNEKVISTPDYSATKISESSYDQKKVLLTIRDLVEILRILKDGNFQTIKWFDLGLYLSLIHDDLKIIETNYPRDAEQCLRESLALWLTVDTEATWDKLAIAAGEVGETSVAEYIKPGIQEVKPTTNDSRTQISESNDDQHKEPTTQKDKNHSGTEIIESNDDQQKEQTETSQNDKWATNNSSILTTETSDDQQKEPAIQEVKPTINDSSTQISESNDDQQKEPTTQKDSSTQTSESNDDQQKVILTIDDLVEILRVLKSGHFQTTNWFDLGLYLGLSHDELDVIEADHPRDAKRCLKECLAKWLKTDFRATRDNLVHALIEVGEASAAAYITSGAAGIKTDSQFPIVPDHSDDKSNESGNNTDMNYPESERPQKIEEPGIQEVKPTTNDSPTQISESNDDQQKDPTTQKDSSTQIASESNDDQKKVILTIENLAEILQVLKDGQFLPTKWFNFGLSLGLSYRECKIIEHKYQRDAEQCLRECLANWLRKDTEATWDRLTNATDQEGEASVASYITSGAAGIETNSQFPIVPDHSDDKTNESGNNTDTNHPESERPQKIEGATKSTTVELTSQKIDKKIASRVLSENITLIIKCIKEFELTELAEKFMEIRIITREEMEDFVKDVKKNTRSYRMNNIKMKQLLIQLERAVSLSLRPGEIFLWLIKILKDYDTVASQEVARKLEAEYNARNGRCAVSQSLSLSTILNREERINQFTKKETSQRKSNEHVINAEPLSSSTSNDVIKNTNTIPKLLELTERFNPKMKESTVIKTNQEKSAQNELHVSTTKPFTLRDDTFNATMIPKPPIQEMKSIFGDMTDLIVDSSGLIHHCSQYGVTLIIPEGAVQEEETVTVHFGTCLYSSKFKFGNYIPVTPIVWVHMSQELMKLAELYLPHHVDATNPLTRSKLTLLTAKDEFFNENELHFTKNDDSVLEVDFALCKTSRNHFCSTCAGIEKSSFENIQKRCWLAVAEKQESDVTFLFHCIIFPSQLACKKTIEKHYSQDFSLDFSFKEMNFDTGAISLTFDPDHDNLKTLGWTSRHFGIYVDEISEDDVDYHKVMHCQFRDMSSKDIHKPPCQDEDTSSKDIEKLEDLEKHRRYPPRFCYEFTCIDKTAAPKVTKVIVTLQGSSVNFRYDINLKQPGYDPSQDTSNLLTHKRENDISSQNLDSLLLGCLEVIPSIFEKFQCYKKWFPFGLSLGLNPSELLSIESRYRTPVQYARAILLLWREKNKEASLESLTAALEKVCLSEAATELQHHFQEPTIQKVKSATIHSPTQISEPNDDQQKVVLTIRNLVEVLRVLKDGEFQTIKWFDLGLYLGLSYNDLKTTETKNSQDADRCLRECLALWLTDDIEATWDKLVDALSEIKENSVATHIINSSSLAVHRSCYSFNVGLSLVDATPAERVSEEVISSTVPEVAHRVISEFASAIKNCGIELSFFAEKLLEKKIINDRQKKKATDEHSRCTTDERMDQLLGIIKNSVQQEGKVFDYILEILKEENTILANKLHDNMINKYEQYK